MDNNSTSRELTQVPQLELVYRTTIPAHLRPSAQNHEEAFPLFVKNWDEGKIDFVEQFKVMLLDTHHRVIGIVTLSTGHAKATLVEIKHVLAAAILGNAESIILAHNHPSGQLDPSSSDQCVTKEIADALWLLGINLLDHLIITRYGYFSFRLGGLL